MIESAAKVGVEVCRDVPGSMPSIYRKYLGEGVSRSDEVVKKVEELKGKRRQYGMNKFVVGDSELVTLNDESGRWAQELRSNYLR